ncbi:hypothetical protein, partial [Altericroceibacterium xinjiangense]|uniref:hypothetical protein n=1 Tax=Altericroceibacterium xinjiangense TaxID=762261 RepID=UPI0019CFCC7B
LHLGLVAMATNPPGNRCGMPPKDAKTSATVVLGGGSISIAPGRKKMYFSRSRRFVVFFCLQTRRNPQVHSRTPEL